MPRMLIAGIVAFGLVGAGAGLAIYGASRARRAAVAAEQAEFEKKMERIRTAAAEEDRKAAEALQQLRDEAKREAASRAAESEFLTALDREFAAQRWEIEQRFNDAMVEMQQHAQTAAAIQENQARKAAELLLMEEARRRRVAEWREQQAAAEAKALDAKIAMMTARADAERERRAQELQERSVYAQERAARAAEIQAAEAGRNRSLNCSSYVDSRGVTQTNCQ
jgi:hypothetical protein